MWKIKLQEKFSCVEIFYVVEKKKEKSVWYERSLKALKLSINKSRVSWKLTVVDLKQWISITELFAQRANITTFLMAGKKENGRENFPVIWRKRILRNQKSFVIVHNEAFMQFKSHSVVVQFGGATNFLKIYYQSKGEKIPLEAFLLSQPLLPNVYTYFIRCLRRLRGNLRVYSNVMFLWLIFNPHVEGRKECSPLTQFHSRKMVSER